MNVSPFACPHCHRPTLGPVKWSYNDGSAQDMEACLELDGVTPHVDICEPWKQVRIAGAADRAKKADDKARAEQAWSNPSPAEQMGRVLLLDGVGKRTFCRKCGARCWRVKREYCSMLLDERWGRHGTGSECGEDVGQPEVPNWAPNRPRDPTPELTVFDSCKRCGQDFFFSYRLMWWGWDRIRPFEIDPLRPHECQGMVERRLRWKHRREFMSITCAVVGGLSFWSGVVALRPEILRVVTWVMGFFQ